MTRRVTIKEVDTLLSLVDERVQLGLTYDALGDLQIRTSKNSRVGRTFRTKRELLNALDFALDLIYFTEDRRALEAQMAPGNKMEIW